MFELIPWTNRDKGVWNYFDNLEKAFFQNEFSGTGQIRTDIVDDGQNFVLSAELPGFSREDIKIDVEGGYLTIRAEKGEKIEENKGNYIRRERKYGSFSRSFDISNVDAERIAAKYDNGVLLLTLPKLDVQPVPPARQIEIQ